MSTVVSWIVNAVLEFLKKLLIKIINYQEQKKQDDKKVDAPVEKIGSGDLKEGLDGTDELEDQLNSNA